MKFQFHLFAALLLCLTLATQSFAQTASEAKNQRQPIREVALSGVGYELGLQHGQIFKKEIGELIAKFKEKTTKELGKDANEVLADFYQKTSFDASIKRWTPELYEEVRGIADGADQPFKDVMVFSLLDEFWVYQDNIENHHCSGVGVPARNGQPGYIAQNMDIEAYTDGYQVLLRIERNGTHPEQLILTHPGCIALNGMNETGIGACMNTLMQLNANTTGLPVAFIVRRITSTSDKDQLLDFIQNVPHASGQNYIIGIREEVYDFEASANKVLRFNPKNENGTVYHTNHPLVNDDLKAWFKKFDPTLKEEDKPVTSNSFVRLAAVQRRVATSTFVTDTVIMDALRSKDDAKYPVCRTPNQWGLTFGSVIMTLTGKPFLQITSGPPDESAYNRVDFSEPNIAASAPFAMEQTSDGKWVILDSQRTTLYEVFPFDNGPDYPSEGLIRVLKNGKIGYADANTYAIVIKPQFNCAFPFENGKAKVSHQCKTLKDGEHKVWESEAWLFVDKNGNYIVSSPETNQLPDEVEFKNGDLIFQTSLSGQSQAVQLATKSKYSHCGIIFKEDNKFYVFEAIQPVKRTPLDKWIARGEDGKYVVKRLKNADQVLTPEVLQKMKDVGDQFKGKNYDLTFEWSDDKIYCSELIWKMYQRSTGIEIGKLEKLSSFDLSAEAVKKKMKERYGNKIPMNEPVISPAAVFESELLITVKRN